MVKQAPILRKESPFTVRNCDRFKEASKDVHGSEPIEPPESIFLAAMLWRGHNIRHISEELKILTQS